MTEGCVTVWVFVVVVRCDQAEGVSRTGNVPKAVLTVEQYDGTRGAVVLWGAALTWLQHIHTNTGKENVCCFVFNTQYRVLIFVIFMFNTAYLGIEPRT